MIAKVKRILGTGTGAGGGDLLPEIHSEASLAGVSVGASDVANARVVRFLDTGASPPEVHAYQLVDYDSESDLPGEQIRSTDDDTTIWKRVNQT